MTAKMWIKTKADTDRVEYWYLDYEKGTVSRSNQKPKYVNVKKWDGSIENFLKNKEVKILEINENEIKFETN